MENITIIILLSLTVVILIFVIIHLLSTKKELDKGKADANRELSIICDTVKELNNPSYIWREKAMDTYNHAVNSKDEKSNTVMFFKNFDTYVKKQVSKAIEPLNKEVERKSEYIKNFHARLELVLQDHKKSFPYLAGMISDYLLLEEFHFNNYQGRSERLRERKLRIDNLLKEKKELISRSKEIQYQLDFLLTAFPALSDYLDTEYRDIPLTFDYSEDHDPTRDYMTAEEYDSLSESDRNQLALDRYIASHKKSKWQIGRDYELSVGYQYKKKGYKVIYNGSLEGVADLGRDLIATKDDVALIIQCKYWSTEKTIREKHIAQLFGTAVCYQVDHPEKKVTPLFVSSTHFSNEAKEFANKLHVSIVENFPLKEFPRIKCNLGRDEFGAQTRIYHLPMDQQYDSVIIDKPGEYLTFTVKEAEQLGFRRAFRWHNN